MGAVMLHQFHRVIGLGILIAVGIIARPAIADDLATCKRESGDVAIVACTRYITSGQGAGRDLVAAYVNRGIEYKNKGDYVRAIADASEGIRTDPTAAMAYINRGSFYYEKGDYDRAITDASEAIRIDPKIVMAFSNRAAAYNRKNDSGRAIADASEAIRLNPNIAQGAYANRAFAFLSKGAYDNAIADASEAIRLDPKMAAAFYTRGTAKRKKGDAVGGDGDIAKANAIQPGIGQ